MSQASQPTRRSSSVSAASYRSTWFEALWHVCVLRLLCIGVCMIIGACLPSHRSSLHISDDEGDDEEFSNETYRKASVHVGFFRVYASVRDEVVALLQSRLEVCAQEGKRAKVYVTGHSLGGAVACLCALDLASLGGNTSDPASLALRDPCVYTFGSPRIGNAAFRSIYNVLVPGTFRMVGVRDIVPTLPPSIRYRQVGREVWIDDAGGLTYAMSWAMRRVLPPRDRAQHHLMAWYFDLLCKAFWRLGGRELPVISSFERKQRPL